MRPINYRARRDDMILEGFFSNLLKLGGKKASGAMKKFFGDAAEKGKKASEWLTNASDKMQKKISGALQDVVDTIKDGEKKALLMTAVDHVVAAVAYYKTSSRQAEEAGIEDAKKWLDSLQVDLQDFDGNELKDAAAQIKDSVLK